MDAQLETGATHDIRIFTGSALLATPARPSTHTPASASFKRRIFSSQFRRACAPQRQASRCENGKIVGGPTDFGKPAAWGKRPPFGTLRRALPKLPTAGPVHSRGVGVVAVIRADRYTGIRGTA